jgi:hypothetical protein
VPWEKIQRRVIIRTPTNGRFDAWSLCLFPFDITEEITFPASAGTFN